MKLALKILAALLGLLLIAILALVLFLDPNMFKPRLEALAREHKVALSIDGDMSWQFWPSLGIEINDVKAAATEAPEQPIMQLGQASLLLEVKPLFRGEVVVHHLIVDGAVINLIVDEQGQGNWELLLPDEEPEAQEQAPVEDESEAAQLELAVERISLRNSALNYVSHQPENPQDISLHDVQLGIAEFNLQGQPFDLELQWQLDITNEAAFGTEPMTIAGDLHTPVQFSTDMNEANFDSGDLTLKVGTSNKSSQLELNFTAAAQGLQDEPKFQADLTLAPLNIKRILTAMGQEAPATTGTYALSEVSLTTRVIGDSTSITADPLTITLDKTRFEGRFAITDLARNAIELVLAGDRINVDDYLPPPQEAPVEEDTATGDEELIPLDAIKPLVADINLDLQQAVVMGMPIDEISLRINAEDGLIKLNKASANLYQGAIAATGSLNARGDTALIKFDGGVKGLQLAPLMADLELDQDMGVTGAVDAVVSGAAQGVTLNLLMASADSAASFSGAQVRISPINVEQKFCQIADLVNKTEKISGDWPEYTEMQQLAGEITFVNQTITVEEFTAAVRNLAMNLRGYVNLAEDQFDLTVPLTLKKTSTSEQGCHVKSNFWLDRSISLLRCRGSLENLDPVSDCRPDSSGLKKLVKDFAAYQVKEKHGEKVEAAEEKLDQEKEEAKQKAEEKIKEEGKRVEDKLKDLLKKR